MSKERVILNGGIAKRLLLRGHILSDLKQKRDNPTQSVYVFFADSFLNADVDDIMAHKSNDSIALKRRLDALQISEKEYKQSIFHEYLGEENS